MFPASDEDLAAYVEATARGPLLRVGTARRAGGGGAVVLRAGGFNRHTFFCGQSGSGKTYALGVVLERLLLETSLKMIVLDPNGDYVRLGRLRDDAPDEARDRWPSIAAGVEVFGAGGGDGQPLYVRFRDLDRRVQATVLGLDPIADREEYHQLLQLHDALGGADAASLLAQLRARGDRDLDRLAMRIENLGVLDWGLWAWGAPGVLDALAEARATVLDLGGFDDARERSAAAVAVLDHLWAERERREPMLIVIDEAHNLCSTEPSDALGSLATERLIQIAGEGRKFGLWLLLATQRPSKIHPNVLSQCDNLVLMRMNAPGDLEEIRSVFGFAPPAIVELSPTFGQGEALLAGTFTLAPTLARIGPRYSAEAGSDIAVPRPG
jgi:uncharacterized protein